MDILSTIYYTMIGLFSQIFIKGIVLYGTLSLVLFIIKKRTKWKLTRCIIEFTLCCYLITLFNLTGVFQLRISSFSEMHAAPNLIPLVNTMSDFSSYSFSVLKQVVLNIVLFVPFGILASSLITKKSKLFFKVLIIAFMISSGIEIIQYFCGRFADIDDVIWNTIGSTVGYLIYKIYLKIKSNIEIKSRNKIVDNL